MEETLNESYFTCPECGSEDYEVNLTRHAFYTFKSGRLVKVEDSHPGCAFMMIKCSRCGDEQEESFNYDELQTFLQYVEHSSGKEEGR